MATLKEQKDGGFLVVFSDLEDRILSRLYFPKRGDTRVRKVLFKIITQINR